MVETAALENEASWGNALGLSRTAHRTMVPSAFAELLELIDS